MKYLSDGLDWHEPIVGEPVIAGLNAGTVDQHLRVGGQAREGAAQMFVDLK